MFWDPDGEAITTAYYLGDMGVKKWIQGGIPNTKWTDGTLFEEIFHAGQNFLSEIIKGTLNKIKAVQTNNKEEKVNDEKEDNKNTDCHSGSCHFVKSFDSICNL